MKKLSYTPFILLPQVYIASHTTFPGAPVAQWVKRWPTDLAVPSSIPARGEIFSTVNGVPLHTAFHYHPSIVLIWLKYCWKGRKITNHPSIHTTFPKISDIQLLPFIFYTAFKLLTTWLSQTLQICKRSFFTLKIIAKTSRISLYFSYLHILKNSHEFRRVFIYKLSSIYFFAQLSKPHRFSI